MSGMRKPSPISISSPRETMASPPAGQFVQRQKDRGGVVVDRNSGRAEQPLEQSRDVDIALAAASRGASRIPGLSSLRMGAMAPSGARPRLVCSTTPVALMTRRSEGRSSSASACATRASMDGPSWPRANLGRAPRRVPGGSRRPRESAETARSPPASARAPHVRPAIRAIFRWRSRIRWYALVRRLQPIKLGMAQTRITVACVRGVAQPGRAPGSGPGGRWFESTRPDQIFQ